MKEIRKTRIIQRSIKIVAGNQFVGNEFKAATSRPECVLKFVELNAWFGAGLKTYDLSKFDRDGDKLALIQQSIDPVTGIPGVVADESLVISGEEFWTILSPGEQLQLKTSGMVEAGNATIYYAEVPLEDVI